MADHHSSASYIRMVQHLIEKCLIFHMSKEECVEALYKHANIKPVITTTIWQELEKENVEFFESYTRHRSDLRRPTEMESEEIKRITVLEKMADDHPSPS